ncbi:MULTISPECIES: sugar phosphate isomerase/epimerase [unclassified Pseudomonas]|uniref:sugar phosphate isomerase/epimerase n=1 Tax=unclassified Pseudomonas TaxID=196821 RepID=UPI0021E1F95A|nr:sugar phosphate isomerase/epimerase [Pseudomonas sp. AU10]MCV2226655.1 sugar phosphate isomerase/epimerase [Pseudomonas sp. AU10]
MESELSQLTTAFCTGLAQQKYMGAEKGLQTAVEAGCTHWYIDASLYGEMVEDWTETRIAGLQGQIAKTGVKPIFHSNFKAPLGSDVEAFRTAAVQYVKREIEIASRLGAPLIIHGGCIVEPKIAPMAKQVVLERYLKSVQELALYAEARGTDIYLESLSSYVNYRIFTHEAQYAWVLEHLQPHANVYFCLNAGHAIIERGLPAAVLRKYPHLIKGIAFRNNSGAQDPYLQEHDDSCDYADVVQAIVETHWQGLVTFETRTQTAKAALADLALMYRQALTLEIAVG